MNVLESVSHRLGRINGQYQRGLESVFSTSGARPSILDDTAWGNSRSWGPGVGRSKKPQTKEQFIEAFTSWVYICVKQNAQTVASIPLRLYVAKSQKGTKFRTVKTRAVDRDRLKYLHKLSFLDSFLTKAEEVEEITEHPFLDLMKNVNPYHNDRDLKEFTTMFLDLTGEGYWLLVKNRAKVGKELIATPFQVYPIPSQHINPIPGKTLDKAIAGYLYKRGNVEVKLREDEIIMFTFPNPKNIFSGFSCVQGVADAVYIQNQMNAFETGIFENRAKVGGILETTELISRQDRERMKADFDQKQKGALRAGTTMVLPRGMKYTRDAMTPMELNFIEGRRINAAEIALAFDVPPDLIMAEGVTYANMDTADYRHAKNGIKPRCDRYAEKLNEKLLPLYDEKLFCAFDDCVPENREQMLKERTEHARAGIISRDEAREEIGKDARGDLAAELLMDGEVTPITGETAQTEKPEPPVIVAPPVVPEEEEEEVAERVLQRIKKKLNG